MLFGGPLWSSHSIFRRPYFLTRFLPALLTPRVVSASCHLSWYSSVHSHVRGCFCCMTCMNCHLFAASCESRCSNEFHWSAEKVSFYQRDENVIISLHSRLLDNAPRVYSLIKIHLVVLGDTLIIITIWLFVTFCVFRADKIPAAQYSSYMESCQKQRQQNSEYSFKGPLTLFILKIDIICLIISTVQWKSIQGLLISSVLCASWNWNLKQTLIKHNKVQIVRSRWSWVLRSYRGRCYNSLKRWDFLKKKNLDERSNIFTSQKQDNCFLFKHSRHQIVLFIIILGLKSLSC